MIFHLPHIALSLRWIPPCAAIIGYSPLYLSKWAMIRLLSLPLPRKVYSWLEETLCSKYQSMMGFYYETWSGVEFCYYGDQIPDEPENVLYISNHQCSLDWVIPEVLCVKQGGYGGRVRYILKDTIKFIPLYGWYLGMRGGIFVKRKQDRDKKAITEGLERYVRENVPVWLVIFPEGTRFTSKNLSASQSFASDNSREVLQHVLNPRTKGFETVLEHSGGHFNAVYDVTLYYEATGVKQLSSGRDRLPNLFNFFTGICRRVHVHVRRIPMEDLPTDVEGRKEWLYEAFSHKDRLLTEVMTQGRYNDPRISHSLSLSRSLLPTLIFTGSVMAAWSSYYGRRWYLASLAFFTMVTFVSALWS